MTEWRKHDLGFLQNAKIAEAAERIGPLAPLLALVILDLNAIGDRRGTLNPLESRPRSLRRRLAAGGLWDFSEDQVAEAVETLASVCFLDVRHDGSIHLPGWSDDEFGIRNRAPKPKGERACDQCGADFKPLRKDHRFCSAECRKKHHEEARVGASDASDGRSDACSDGRSDAPDGEIEGRTESLPSRSESSERPPLEAIHSESAAAAVDVSLLDPERQTRSYASTSGPVHIADILPGAFRGRAV